MSAQVIQFSTLVGSERSCVNCVHYLSSERDTRCGLFDVQILSEKIAASDCEAFTVEGD